MNMNMVPKDGGNQFSRQLQRRGDEQQLPDRQHQRRAARPRADRGQQDPEDLRRRRRLRRSDPQGQAVVLRRGPVVGERRGARRRLLQREPGGVLATQPLGGEPADLRPTRPGRRSTIATRRTRALRLTWQATTKQKIAFNGSVQDYCWCYSYFITNPEAAWDFHVYPNNNWMVTWTYPATNRLLFQAGARCGRIGSSTACHPRPGDAHSGAR